MKKFPINILAERYEVGEFIARGSLAEVYRGRALAQALGLFGEAAQATTVNPNS